MELTTLPSEHGTLIALVLPVLISIIIQTKMSTAVQSIVALATCTAVTFLVNAAEGEPLGQGLGAVIATSFVAYKTFYEPTGIAGKVEDMTNFGGTDA
jgi:hypothetical protein